MSRFSNVAAYPRSMVGGTTSGLWNPLEEQTLGLGGITGQDQFETIDCVLASTLNTLGKSQLYGQPTMGLGAGAQKKFRVVCPEIGFIPHTVKVFIKGNMLHVIGLVEDITTGVPTTKVFKQKYPVPHTADIQRLVKLFTERGQLVIEMPILGASSQVYPNIVAGRFGVLSALDQEGLHPSNVNVVINMSAQEEDKLFDEQMGIPSLYKRSLNMPQSSEISSPFGWNPYKRTPYPEQLGSNLNWEFANIATGMPTSMDYKPYKSYYAC